MKARKAAGSHVKVIDKSSSNIKWLLVDLLFKQLHDTGAAADKALIHH